MKFLDIIKHIVRNILENEVVQLRRNSQMDYVRIVPRRQRPQQPMK